MKLVALIAVLTTLTGCGKFALRHPAPAKSLPQRAELQSEYNQRLTAYEDTTAPQSGWPSVTDCDGAVWAGVACLAGAAVDIALAAWEPGEIHRRPKASGECYPSGAPSTVSRDDLVLYMACAVELKATGLLKDLQTYAAAHHADPIGSWMGEPHDAGYTLITPTLLGILSRALGGAGVDVEAPGAKDYQEHIEVEEILLSTSVNGGANGWELVLLQSLAAQAPSDALFQAALGVFTGDFSKATDLLLDPTRGAPSYVRGAPLYSEVWWLRAARLVLDHTKD